MRLRPELMQLEIGISTRRYFPASGTAGLERSLVSGKRRLPAPPPIITASTLLVLGDIRLPCVWLTTIPFLRRSRPPLYLALLEKGKRQPIRIKSGCGKVGNRRDTPPKTVRFGPRPPRSGKSSDLCVASLVTWANNKQSPSSSRGCAG